MYDIELTNADSIWLNQLARKICNRDKKSERELKALEYFYRAWPLAPEERFPIYCMALDALYADGGSVTQSVVDGIQNAIGTQVGEKRLKHLLNLRGAVIHGRAPNVYEDKKYPAYFKKYGADPISDLELIVGQGLRLTVFEGNLVEHTDPNADLIRKLQQKGRIPPVRRSYSILNPNPDQIEVTAPDTKLTKLLVLVQSNKFVRRLIRAYRNF